MSYAALRKRIQVGTTVRITNYLYPHLNREVQVVRAQTNAFTSPATRANGTPVSECWIYWPKASDTTMIDDNTVALYEGDPNTGERREWLRVEVVA